MRVTTASIALSVLVVTVLHAEQSGDESSSTPKGRRMDLVCAVDLSTGKLQTVGSVEVDDGGVPLGRQILVKTAGKRVWKLNAGDVVAFTFELPAESGAVVIEIDEVGWAESSLASGIALSVNGNDVRPLPVAPARTFKTHRLTFGAGKCLPGTNEIAVANNERGVIGLQGFRVKCLADSAAPRETGDEAPKGGPGKPHDSGETTTSGKTEDDSTALLDRGAKPDVASFLDAAKSGKTEAVKEALAAGADAEAANEKGFTALHLAASGGHLETVKCLLEAGVKLDRRTNRMGGGYATPLYLAAKEGHAEIVTLLAEHGAPVDAAAMQSWTAMHIAAANGHLEAVRALIAAGGNAGALSDLSDAPIHWAAQNGHTEVVKALIEEGKADKRATNAQGCTALHLAAENGHFETAKYLIDIGVPINASTAKNQTATDLCNPRFVRQWRSVKDTSRHKKVYDHLRSRGGKHQYELK